LKECSKYIAKRTVILKSILGSIRGKHLDIGTYQTGYFPAVCWWFILIILAIPEAEIRRIEV
jgi:hypothetical protein